ncbi:hypothetical protein [Pedobacter heparinus]|uniref:hypothetical protein n=1 Tax=Pedobacter heparinus TaxID=984 RepID=UPI00293165B0|nr:hypothetical protein [Pedobacter heparinus]
MKETNQGILQFSNLLNEIADTKAKLIKPDDFADRSHKAYKALLRQPEDYLLEGDQYHSDRYQEMKEKLELLLARPDELVSFHSRITGDINISPYQASLAIYVSSQLTEALDLINPVNMF